MDVALSRIGDKGLFIKEIEKNSWRSIDIRPQHEDMPTR